ncbi:MAG: xanthine dehydrogenase family protein molybdopterin-binding subunit [Coprothermobacterota bacterium]|nr:xanthine dehydrogenase family protein molybdopterin-binding subunit [Coprothermobacterota bacterium]
MTAPFRTIGQPVGKIDGVELVTGRARYTADLQFPGSLQAVARRAGVAAGLLRHLNVEEARRSPGVVLVLTPADLPGPNLIGILPPFDQPLLAGPEIRHEGDSLALVVAETQEEAEAAASRIVAEIEPFIPLLDPEEALHADARKIHANGNLTFAKQLLKGDVEAGFAQAEVIVEDTYRTSVQDHAYLEPEAVLAVPESDGRLTVYASCQSPFHLRGHIAVNTGLPASRVKVVQPFVGGSFGGKDDAVTEMGSLAGAAALKLGRPVRIVHSRRDSFLGSHARHAAIIHLKTGAMRDGTIIARQAEILLDGGAYASESPFVVMKALIHVAGPYKIPHLRVDCRAVYTNKRQAGAMRGFGVPQVTFASESQIDALARKLGLDRWELRRHNALTVGEANATSQVFHESVGLVQTLERVKEEGDWPACLKRAHAGDNPRFKRGVGLAAMMQGISNGAEGIDVVGASVQVSQDGSVLVGLGLTELGQGSRTAMAQIAAEILGVSLEKISVRQVDTDTVHDSGPTVASRTTTVGGKAVWMAAQTVRTSLLEMAGLMLKAPAEAIELGLDHAYLRENPQAQIPLAQVATAAYWTGFPLMNLAFSRAPDAQYDHETHQGQIYIAYNYGTHLMEVEVDTWTGKVRVLRHLASHDVGKAINPLGVEGQVEGASLMGLGFAHLEEVLEENGKIRNANFADYQIPSFAERLPTRFLPVEEATSNGPFGAKGIGEPPLAGAAAAFTNAVSDALGISFRRLPITPQRILEALEG